MLSKQLKIALVALVITLVVLVPGSIYADTGKTQVSTTVFLVAVAGLMVGAIANTVRGWWNAPQVPVIGADGKPTGAMQDAPYSYKKLGGSILMSVIQIPIAFGYGAIVSQIGDAGILMAFWTMFAQGFTVDVLHTATKN